MSNFSRIAFLFPGQGDQYPGMGKDFFEQYPIARQTFQEADDLLHRHLSPIAFDGPEQLLTETKNSQLAIYVMSMALLRVVTQEFPHLKPSICAGLSLGEYTALAAAGYVTFEQGLKLVDHRSRYMNDACEKTQGTMAAVLGLDGDVVEQIVKDVNMPDDLWAANFNCPGQVVISGTLRGIEVGSVALKEKGARRVLPLQVHGAFHSGLMKQAQEQLAPHILETSFQQPHAALVMNVTGKKESEPSEIKRLLIAQVTQPVRWEQGMRQMNDDVDLFIKIGCGKTLEGFHKRIGVSAPIIGVEKIIDLEELQRMGRQS